jgi:hypothetical protein
MTTPDWQISGQYYETCSCDFICLCFPGGLTVTPTQGTCTVAMAFQVEHGAFDHVPLEDLGFILVVGAPAAMARGNWTVGIVVDVRATGEQRHAIQAIATGSAGGPMAALSSLFGTFLGVQSAAIHFDRRGHKWSVRADDAVQMSGTGVMSVCPNVTEPIHFDHTGHPAAGRFALAHPTGSHIHAFDLSWDDISGKNNAQYAPFAWHSA